MKFKILNELAKKNNVGLKYSATFCGGLPVINLVQRDLVVGNILKFEGILNATTNFILDEMKEKKKIDHLKTV